MIAEESDGEKPDKEKTDACESGERFTVASRERQFER
jgi:hypothetical protein